MICYAIALRKHRGDRYLNWKYARQNFRANIFTYSSERFGEFKIYLIDKTAKLSTYSKEANIKLKK